MRQLNAEEQSLLAKRRSGFSAILDEIVPVLADFLGGLGLSASPSVAENAEKFLAALDAWLSWQTIHPDDRTWVVTRIGYFIGELLRQRFDGRWLLDEDPSSPYFLQYVVGDFASLPIVGSRISPFAVASNFIDEPTGRSLARTLSGIDEDLRRIITAEPSTAP